jgi:hypothetical protein
MIFNPDTEPDSPECYAEGKNSLIENLQIFSFPMQIIDFVFFAVHSD